MPAETPSPRPAEPKTPTPAGIPKPSAVDNDAVPDIGSKVARQVADVREIGRRVIHIDVFDVIDGRSGRNAVNVGRHIVGHDPGPLRAVGNEPNAIADRVVSSTDENNVVGRVYGVHHVGAFDGLELRFAIVGGGELCILAVDRRCLRYLRGNYRVLSLRRAWNADQNIALSVIWRNALEILGQRRGTYKLPWTVKLWGTEPAA